MAEETSRTPMASVLFADLIGYSKRAVTGQAVADKVVELVAYGAMLVVPIEEIDGVWTAVCDTRSSG